jgi:hypothetical protein
MCTPWVLLSRTIYADGHSQRKGRAKALTTYRALRKVVVEMSILARTKRTLLSLVGKSPKVPKDPAERRRILRDWLEQHPEMIEAADRGFRDIREGRYEKLSRPSDQR